MKINQKTKELLYETYAALSIIGQNYWSAQRRAIHNNLNTELFAQGFEEKQINCIEYILEACVAIKATKLMLFSALYTLGFEVEE